MLTLKRNRRGQGTAEYATLIALAIAGVISMQQYVQRGFQGRMRDATVFLREEGSRGSEGRIGTTLQYEPYYINQSAQIDRDSRALDTGEQFLRNETRTRLDDDFVQQTDYINSAVDSTGIDREDRLGY